MNDMKTIIINKNRGWRGLAEIDIINEDHCVTTKHIFSFSQPMWDDLINNHKAVIASDKYYYVIHFEDPLMRLPSPTQQRSVLIKNFVAQINSVTKISKDEWRKAEASDWSAILNFIRNRNNHTQSNWNCIGIRVTPEI